MIKHGQRRPRTPEYSAWADMKGRCSNPNLRSYKSHGAKGITYCKEWEDFIAFYNDMGDRPGKGYSLERINNGLGYFKDNCKWATAKEQGRNRSTNVSIDYKGIKYGTLTELAETVGIKRAILGARIFKLGWSVEKAVESPLQQQDYAPRRRKANV